MMAAIALHGVSVMLSGVIRLTVFIVTVLMAVLRPFVVWPARILAPIFGLAALFLYGFKTEGNSPWMMALATLVLGIVPGFWDWAFQKLCAYDQDAPRP
jgi:hypothetical protein